MSVKELIIFITTILAFSLIGATGGISGTLVFGGLGLLIWVVWRGRKL